MYTLPSGLVFELCATSYRPKPDKNPGLYKVQVTDTYRVTHQFSNVVGLTLILGVFLLVGRYGSTCCPDRVV